MPASRRKPVVTASALLLSLLILVGCTQRADPTTQSEQPNPPAAPLPAISAIALPAVATPATTAGSAPLNRRFGRAVAIDRGVALIAGVEGEQSSSTREVAYIYDFGRSSSGIATQLFVGAPSEFLRLGSTRSVALSTRFALVGMQDGIHIFRREPRGYQKAGQIRSTAADDRNQLFGATVALTADAIIVGAPHTVQAGTVLVYGFKDNSWQQQQVLKGSESTPADLFGDEVVIDGERMLVSAWLSDNSRGAVYVYEKAAGKWVERARLSGPGADSWQFGRAVALAGDVAFISENGYEVHMFRHTGEQWRLEQTVRKPDPEANNTFGDTLAIDRTGTLLLIAAPSDGEGANYSGAVYVYRNEQGTWKMVAKLKAPHPTEDAAFGTALALDDHTAIVGSWRQEAFRFDPAGSLQLETPIGGEAHLLNLNLLVPALQSPVR